MLEKKMTKMDDRIENKKTPVKVRVLIKQHECKQVAALKIQEIKEIRYALWDESTVLLLRLDVTSEFSFISLRSATKVLLMVPCISTVHPTSASKTVGW
jgi:hypothetical protein